MKTTINFKFIAMLLTLLVTTFTFAQKTVTTKYRNGQLATSTPYNAAGNLHGTVKKWNYQGQLTETDQYVDGERTGLWTLYLPSGLPQEQTRYVKGERVEFKKWQMLGGKRTFVEHSKWNTNDTKIFYEYRDPYTEEWCKVLGPLANGKGLYNNVDDNAKINQPVYKEIYFDSDTCYAWWDFAKTQFAGKLAKDVAMTESDAAWFIKYDKQGNVLSDMTEVLAKKRQQAIADSIKQAKLAYEKHVADSIKQAKELAIAKARQQELDSINAIFANIYKVQDMYKTMLASYYANSEAKFFQRLVDAMLDKNLKQSTRDKLSPMFGIESTYKAAKKFKWEVVEVARHTPEKPYVQLTEKSSKLAAALLSSSGPTVSTIKDDFKTCMYAAWLTDVAVKRMLSSKIGGHYKVDHKYIANMQRMQTLIDIASEL